MENMDRPDRLIVGVVYAAGEQTTLDEMYTNEDGSPRFEAFMDTLAEKARRRTRARVRCGRPAGDSRGRCRSTCAPATTRSWCGSRASPAR